ncbi:glycoside hydrolase family 47 protein, partial [Phycomyces blakesleeanus NRRL 1555(-)]
PPPPPPPPPPPFDPLKGHTDFETNIPPIQRSFGTPPLHHVEKCEQRRLLVKKAFLHGWTGYKTYAMGADELMPISNKSHNPFGGWGATLVDSLSTLLIMELDSEVELALTNITALNFTINENISVFESTIRYLGGFLSAYELSEQKYPVLLDKAISLANTLLPAFDSPSGLPYHHWNTATKKSPNQNTFFAEAGTVQLEFMMLTRHTGNPVYQEKAQAITDLLDRMGYEHGLRIPGLYPSEMDTRGRFKKSMVSFGAMGDSAFEYFLKEHLLVEGENPQYARMYTESIDSMTHHMLRQLSGTPLLYLPPYNSITRTPDSYMDHLTCFVPGMLAMGAKVLDRPQDMILAKGLLETCVYMYRHTNTGLSPEIWSIAGTEPYDRLTYNRTKEELDYARNWWFKPNATIPPPPSIPPAQVPEEELYPENYVLGPMVLASDHLRIIDWRYLLRPETVESIYILYRITGDPKYQEWGWDIFEAIEKHCKTPSAYAVVRNVLQYTNAEHPYMNHADSMESFLFAETFKYLYLLFSPPDIISLDHFVFNTEAHPFRR